jgi:alpha-L-fucosidase 2
VLVAAALAALAPPARAQCLPLVPRSVEGNFIIPGALGDIVYSREASHELALDVYVQQGGGPRPLIVVVHGGGGSAGSRIAFVGQLLETLTDAGFNWASIDYRLGPTPDSGAAQDVAAAVRFLRCHAAALGVDASRIVLLGEDTGGMLVREAAAALEPTVQALVYVGARYQPVPPIPPSPSPPQLAIHGSDDRDVPLDDVRAHCDAVRLAGEKCTLVAVGGASHRAENWWPSQWAYKRRLLEWLVTTVGDPGPHQPRQTRLLKRQIYNRAENLALDFWRPEGAGPFPLVVLIHGGGWEAGDRVTYITPLFAPLARAGFAWASIDYRLTPQVAHPSQLADVRRAVEWLRREAPRLRIDPARVALVGESASGQMVAELAAERLGLSGVVSFYGVYDFTSMVTDASPRSLLRRLFGRTTLDDEARRTLRQFSPLYDVRAGMSPMLLVHGTNERLWEQGVAMDRALRQAGVEHTLIRLDGAPHGMENWEGHPEWVGYKEQVVSWLRDRFSPRR